MLYFCLALYQWHKEPERSPSAEVFWENACPSPAEGFDGSERLRGWRGYLDLDLSIDLSSLLSGSSFLGSRGFESCRRFSSPSSSDLISELTEEVLWPWRPPDRAAGEEMRKWEGFKRYKQVNASEPVHRYTAGRIKKWLVARKSQNVPVCEGNSELCYTKS